MKKQFFLFVFTFTWVAATAQVQTQYFDTPVELERTVGDYAKEAASFVLPALDKKALADEYDKAGLNSGPYQFAVSIPVSISAERDGRWTEGKGERRWTMKITSKGAYSQTIIFKNPKLVPGATIQIFDGDRKMLFGPIDNTNWMGLKEKLISDIIPGETAYIVYTEPNTNAPATNLEIMEVCYGFRDVFEKMAELDPNKNTPQDLVCALGNNWRAEARSVVLISNNGVSFCSGVLVNTTLQDFRPYVLTANHCDCNGDDAANYDFRFFFWETTCNTNMPNAGATNFVNGASKSAAWIDSDMLLVKMIDNPANSGVVFAGWDRGTVASTSSTGLHHPGGTTMQVAVENNDAVSFGQAVPSNTFNCGLHPSDHFWQVNFDVGGTIGGSSGSPLFNQNHRVVGQLAGSLIEPVTPTDKKYGRLDKSWTGGSTNSTRLSNWLSPSTNATILGATTSIQGPTNVGSGGAVYSIPNFRNPGNLAGYTYTWTTSSNLMIVTGQNTAAPVIKAIVPGACASGTITVNVTIAGGINVCAATRTVFATACTAPPAPATNITISSGGCSRTLTVTAPAGACQYNWTLVYTLSAACGGDVFTETVTTNTPTLAGYIYNMTCSNSGSMTVQASVTGTNACGTSTAYSRNFVVTFNNCPLFKPDDPNDKALGNTEGNMELGTTPIELGISSNLEELSIWPNPAGSFVEVRWETVLTNVQIEVMDGSGRVVKSLKPEDGNMQSIDVNNWPKGGYILSLKSDQSRTAKKFIVE